MKEGRAGKLILFAITMINLYFFAPYIYRSYVKIEKLKKEELEVKKNIELTKKQIAEYNRGIDTLEDEFQVEKIARNKLQMVKDKEEIYRFINK